VDGGRSAALLVRVWCEDGARTVRGRLTSRVTSPGGPDGPETTVAVVASPDGVLDAVRAWLADVLETPPHVDDGDA
jgi:transglutaminase-like putative cysteine protease